MLPAVNVSNGCQAMAELQDQAGEYERDVALLRRDLESITRTHAACPAADTVAVLQEKVVL